MDKPVGNSIFGYLAVKFNISQQKADDRNDIYTYEYILKRDGDTRAIYKLYACNKRVAY